MSAVEKLSIAHTCVQKSLPATWETGLSDKILGEGVTGKVYAAVNETRAIKLCRRSKPYDRFIAFASETSNPHLPKIFGVKYARPGRMRVEMERLQPLDPETADWQTINVFANTCHAVAEGRPVADTAIFGDAMNDFAWSLGRFARTNRFALDLQCANIMIRQETGELVFVDPLR